MDKIWEEMYNAAKAVLKPVTISDYVSAGEVSAAERYIRVFALIPVPRLGFVQKETQYLI